MRANINELARHQHIKTPTLLLKGEKYKTLSGNAFKLYVALLERFSVSVKNNWIDDDGDVYFHYSITSLAELLSYSRNTVKSARNDLMERELLEEVEVKGEPKRLYLNLPVPINDEEAKFILYPDESKYNPAKINDLTNQSRSEKMQGNQNASKNSASQKLTPSENSTGQKMIPSDFSDEINVSETSKNSTGQNMHTSYLKDIKDVKDDKGYKESYDDENDLFDQSLSERLTSPEENRELIETMIKSYSLRTKYGNAIVDDFIKWSLNDFDRFKLFTDKLTYAHKSVMDEQEIDFEISDAYYHPDYQEMQESLSKDFYKVIMNYKQGKVKSFNDYLFIAFKNSFENFAKRIKRHQAGIQEVPLYNWLEESPELEKRS